MPYDTRWVSLVIISLWKEKLNKTVRKWLSCSLVVFSSFLVLLFHLWWGREIKEAVSEVYLPLLGRKILFLGMILVICGTYHICFSQGKAFSASCIPWWLLLSRNKQVLKSILCSWPWWTGTSTISFFLYFSCLHALINKTILHPNV